MKHRLLQWLECPTCSSVFTAEAFVSESDGILEGALHCRCQTVVPIVGGIPRFLKDWPQQFPEFATRYRGRFDEDLDRASGAENWFQRWQERTRKSFGYQWTVFGRMVCDFRMNFLNYVHPLTSGDFAGRLGLDVGCGFGRHIFNAAGLGAEMVGVDLSRAIDVAARNTKELAGVHLIQADLYRLPLRPGTFDLVYSLGVLHHLPDPQGGFEAIVQQAKPNGHVAVWLYSTSRRFTNIALEAARFVARRLPLPVLKGLAYLAAAIDWGGFILPYKCASRLPGLGRIVDRLTLSRVKIYSAYPFQVAAADWFDRLSAPIRYYYRREDVERWFREAGLTRIQVSPTGLYGWRGCGQRPVPHANAVPGQPTAQQSSVESTGLPVS